MRCSVWALVVLGCLIAAAGPLRADARGVPSTTPPFDDSKWVKYVGPEYLMYCAFRGPKQQPGPVVQGWLQSSEASLTKSDAPDNPIGRAVKTKVLVRALDLFDGGGAAALAGNAKNGKILVVLARTPVLDGFLEWVKKTYTKAPYQAKAATVGGVPAVLWEEKGKVELAVGITDTEVVMADKQADLEAALKLGREGGKGFARTFGYERLRRRAKPSATAVFSMVPGEHILEMMQEQNNFPGLERAARVGIETMNGNFIELNGTPSVARFDYYLSVDPKSEGYQTLKLDKRHKFYATRSVKAAEAIPGDAVAFFTGLQPSYDTREMAASSNLVGLESSPSNQQQWDVLKGQLQVQTGLSFDAEVVPWLGPESAAFVRPAAGDGYEIGGLVDVTDPAAAQASLDKAVRHIKISRGVPFAEGTVSGIKLHKAAPAEKNPAFAPAACVTDKHLILGTAPAIVEATVQFPLKAAAGAQYTALNEALGKRRIVMALWSQTAPISRLIRKFEEARGAKPGAKPSEVVATLDGLDALAAGVAVPESDLVHMHLQVWGK
jgi:hypothetical protein